MSDSNADTSRQVNRRSFLKTSSGALATVAGVAGFASQRGAAATLEHDAYISAGETYIYYTFHVSGDIEAATDPDSGTYVHDGWVEGSVDENDDDAFDFSGNVTKVYLAGSGQVTVNPNGDDTTEEYKAKVTTDYHDDSASYLWRQDGYIYERNNSLNSNDYGIYSDNTAVQGKVGQKDPDEFWARGHPSYFDIGVNDVNFTWHAYDF